MGIPLQVDCTKVFIAVCAVVQGRAELLTRPRNTSRALGHIENDFSPSGPEAVTDVDPEFGCEAERFDIDALVVAMKAVHKFAQAHARTE